MTEKCAPAAADAPATTARVEPRVHPDHDRPGAPGVPRGADAPRRRSGGAAGGVRVAAAQPGGGEHRRGQRRADRAASAFSPRTSTVLPWILVCPNGALLVMPVDPPLHRVDVHEGQLSAPGSSGARLASSASSARLTFSSWRTFPQVKERRNEPSVDGARIPPNSSSIAPCRSRSMSSMLSAPAAIPATRQATFTPGITPHGPPWPDHALRPARCSPARSASAMTGTSPARDTRFGSSKRACDPRQAHATIALAGVLSNWATGASDTPIVPVQRAPFYIAAPPASHLFTRWIEAKAGPPNCRDTEVRSSPVLARKP